MQVCFKSEAGSIRDNNHDFVLHDKQLGLVVVTGGVRLKSQEEAETIANSLVSSLTEFHSVITPEDAQYRLKEVFADVVSLHEITGIGNFLSALWLVDGFIVGVAVGNVSVISFFSEQSVLLVGQDKAGYSTLESIQCFDCQKVSSGDKIVIVSEGVNRAIKPQELYSKLVSNNTDEELTPASVLNISKNIYAGDDNTAVTIDFTERDTLKNTPEEIVLKTHFDRQFSVKLWLPIAVVAGLFIAFSLVIKKAYSKISKETTIFSSILKLNNLRNKNFNKKSVNKKNVKKKNLNLKSLKMKNRK